jgi:hypothetical protein
MGMSDIVVFEMELPDFPPPGRRFQTKAFDRCEDFYTVTKAGRLCLTGNEFGAEPLAGSNETGDVDIDFHGDIRLISEDEVPEESGEYMARFTHGTLEWVRPMADLPLAQLALKKSERRGA